MTKSETFAIAAAAAAIGGAAAYYVTTTVKKSRPTGSSTPGKPGERQYLVAGNWKCNGTVEEQKERIKIFNQAGPIPSNVDVAICAPYVHLPLLLEGLRSDIEIGAQDCGSNKSNGAFTGQVGSHQIKDLGCTWVIIGHSEIREGFGMAGEPVELCAEKAKIAIENGLKVMFCIGERKEEREKGNTMKVCTEQLEPLKKALTQKDWDCMAIAYEPVWAIGTGLTATPAMAQETHKDIRKWISENVSPNVAKAVRIQYGGSMKGANAKELLGQPDIDGGLIGGASLTADFFNVINGVEK